ncbi:RNA polymerase sigma factor [Haloferula helveola]|uniref:RNA polymerase sigma factor n=1 Tax=Haloferula helveola TaxID=490095 RepID=A0ABM7RE09_9BACT|nr:RNA polymerase sigma factor [Haloferula helveola]
MSAQPQNVTVLPTGPAREHEFVRLLTEHQDSIRAFIHSLMPGNPAVRDVTQETLMLLWQKRDSFTLGTSFINWAFAVARFRVLEFHRRSKRDQRLVFSDELLDSLAGEPEEMAPQRLEGTRTALRECLASLSDKNRELVRLRYEGEQSIEDFAEDSGRSAGALRVSLFRIRNSLKKCIRSKLAVGRIHP